MMGAEVPEAAQRRLPDPPLGGWEAARPEKAQRRCSGPWRYSAAGEDALGRVSGSPFGSAGCGSLVLQGPPESDGPE